MKLYARIAFVLNAIFLSLNSHAAQKEKLSDHFGAQVISATQRFAIEKTTSIEQLATALGLGKHGGLIPLRVETRNGITYGRYRQSFRGVPIHGYQILVHRRKDGTLHHLNATLIKGLDADLPTAGHVSSAHTPADAFNRFRKTTAGRTWSAQREYSPRSQDQHSDIQRPPSAEGRNPADPLDNVELSIYLDDTGTGRLVYSVFNFLFDANTLELIDTGKLKPPPINPCNDSDATVQYAFVGSKKSCESKEGCKYIPAGPCYCPPNVRCICGGGPPPQCMPESGL